MPIRIHQIHLKMNRFLMFFMVTSQALLAQFKLAAKLESVPKNGTYQIVLPTKIASASNKDFSDLRIFDSSKNEVPYYVVRGQLGAKSTKQDFTIISRTSQVNKKSSLIFKNTNQKLDYIDLEIANYSGSKTFILSGSNNNKDWFGILEPTILEDLKGDNLTVIKTLNFPKTNYAFIKIETIDKNSLPINILNIKQLSINYLNRNYQQISTKSIKIVQFKSEKNTRIIVEFFNIELIDKMTFEIVSPANYKRDIRLYENISRKIKRKTVNQQIEFANFELTPASNKNLLLNQKRIKSFVIEIDNLNNPPLDVNTINFYQEAVVVATSLQSNKIYTVKTADTGATLPQYDLSEIQTNDIQNLPKVKVLSIEKLQKADAENSGKQFWNAPGFLWICIGFATAVVLFFVVCLLRDLNKSISS